LLDQGIIEPSTASYYYSQVILASKPDDTWDFALTIVHWMIALSQQAGH
jgi:hypothetical protein